MRHLPLILVLIVLLLPTAAPAQEGWIGVYENPEGTDCDINASLGIFELDFVFWPPEGGATGVSFSAPVPICSAAAFVGQSSSHITLGTVTTGILVSFDGECLEGPIHLLTAQYAGSPPSPCCVYPVLENPLDDPPGLYYSDCATPEVRHETRGFPGILNGNGSCPCDSHEIPVMDPEPAYTPGTSNTVSWSDEHGGHIAQCAEDPAFTTIFTETEYFEGNSYEFGGLTDGQEYFYRAKTINGPFESEWSDPVSSTQDATDPESMAGPLAPVQYSQTFDIPFTADDETSGVEWVELLFLQYPPDTSRFGWEDGTSTVLHFEGCQTVGNSNQEFYGGHRSLRLRMNDSPGCSASLAWVQGLVEGDEVTAGFWRHDDNMLAGPDCRIWGRWNDHPTDVTVDDGDAGGNPSPGSGTGWRFLSYTWTVPAGHSGLVIEARLSAGSGSIYVDDLHVVDPLMASTRLPDGSLIAPPLPLSYFAFTESPATFTAPSEGRYGFFTRAWDHVGNIEPEPEVIPDVTTLVLFASGIDDTPMSPGVPLLSRNRPNPFGPPTRLHYHLLRPTRVTLEIFDVTGRLVRSLRDGVVEEAGSHEVLWEGRDDSGTAVPSGTYLYRITAGERVESMRMTLLR